MDLIESAGLFIYPLLLCSFVALMITLERCIALRPSRVIPRAMLRPLYVGTSAN